MTTMHSLSWSYSTTATHSLLQLARYGESASENATGGASSSYSDTHRVLDSGSAALDTFAMLNRGVQPSSNSAPSFPQQQRPFSPDSSSGSAEHSGRQNYVAGRVVRNCKGIKILRSVAQEQQKSGSKSPQAASSIFPAVEGKSVPISITPGSVFLPTTTALDTPFPECLRLDGDSICISNVFSMALTCCVVAQWIKIAGGLTLWASRLRLRFFETPLVYKNSTKLSKLGRIGVFWDLENCPVPNCCEIRSVIAKVRAIGNNFGEIQCFRAYGKLDCLMRQAVPFLNEDVELCPVPDGKESADKAIVQDASLFAFDHKSCPGDTQDSEVENDAVLVLTGDRGFAALLKELSKRNMTTIVIGNAHQPIPSVLSQSADFSIGWDDMIINDNFDNSLSGNSSESFMWPCSQKLQSELQDLSDVDCYELNSTGSELFCTTSSGQPLVYGLPKVFSPSTTDKARIDRMVKRLQGGESNSCETADDSKFAFPIGGKIRVLRHLRYEVAAIADKYCNKGTCIDLREFMRLYEVEMGHALIPWHYGCGSVKTLLESMPDLVTLRPCSNSEIEVFPFYPKVSQLRRCKSPPHAFFLMKLIAHTRGNTSTQFEWKGEGRNGYGKINYNREDLRCILYELLRTSWPYGVKKDNLSSEHVRITGRPFVLVNYEYLKAGDVFGSMRDIVYIDPRSKQLHLVDGAQEPAGYTDLARSHWS